MAKSKWTVMLIPHDHESVKSIHVSTSGVRAILSGLLIVVLLMATVTTGFFLKQSQHARALILEEELVQRELDLSRSRREVEDLRNQVLDQAIREDQIRELEARYTELAALVEGQEQIARIHRDILADRRWSEYAFELALSFAAGVLSTIFAQYVLLRPRVATEKVGTSLADLNRDR